MADAKRGESMERQERLDWHSMFASVLDGDVFRSEKNRIQGSLELTSEAISTRQDELWLGIRARLRCRTVDEERLLLAERRRRVVNMVVSDLVAFKVDTSVTLSPYHQVERMLHRLDIVQALFPSQRSFHSHYNAPESIFMPAFEALVSWFNIHNSLRDLHAALYRWTSGQVRTNVQDRVGDHMVFDDLEHFPHAKFVDQTLNGQAFCEIFERGLMSSIYGVLAAARASQVKFSSKFTDMALPTFDGRMRPLIRFPIELAEACLRVRLDYAKKVKQPEVLIVDQLLEDFRMTIGEACKLKRQYEELCFPHPAGSWRPDGIGSSSFESIVLDSLAFFFQLINWKLQSATKDIFYKETDVLEAHWSTFDYVSETIFGGSSLVAEQVCALTSRAIARLTTQFIMHIDVLPESTCLLYSSKKHYFKRHSQHSTIQLHGEHLTTWFSKILENVRVRFRKLQKFGRSLPERFSNAAEYSLLSMPVGLVISNLVESGHFLVYTKTFEEDGIYVVASNSLRDKPLAIRRLLESAFDTSQPYIEFGRVLREQPASIECSESAVEGSKYLLVMSPRAQFLWTGLVLVLPIAHYDFGMRANRVRLIAGGSQARLAAAKQAFIKSSRPFPVSSTYPSVLSCAMECVVATMAHLPSVHREVKKVVREANRLAEVIAVSADHVRHAMNGTAGSIDLLESWYLSVSEHGQYAQKHMGRSLWLRFNRLLICLSVSWVSFICDDCDPQDRKTFRWAVSALEFTLQRTHCANILYIPDPEFEMLRQKVASCMTLLINHYDILGARSTQEAKRDNDKRDEAALSLVADMPWAESNEISSSLGIDEESRSVALYKNNVMGALRRLEMQRKEIGATQNIIGRVLDHEILEDRSLMFLASSTMNISIRWQQGKVIGVGAFGSVYMAVNLESGSIMAVKEIRHHDVLGTPRLLKQLQEELRVMELLHHPNIVEYYGIEVHRDRIYLFEEYCEGGSLAANLEIGRIADEHILQVYTMQMLEGLSYLHSQGVVHRDVKPDNILLDRMGVLKFVDFGAAKVLVKSTNINQHLTTSNDGDAFGADHSLTGTPMYMAPEVVKNDKRGRHGAMDVWSMGCVILECSTGRKPWSNLDNEWAIMFHIGVATQHPPLPERHELSALGISFIQQCLDIDALGRPTAQELMQHPWMLQFVDTLEGYERDF